MADVEFSVRKPDLEAIENLTPSNDDFLQRKAGAWANRTIAQVKTDLAVPVASDVAYDATSWDGNTDVPTKNAVRDKIETMGGGGITNSAGNNVIPKSDGTNIVASNLSDSGTLVASAVQMRSIAGTSAAPGIQVGTTAGNGLFGDDTRLAALVGNQGDVQWRVGTTSEASGGVGLYVSGNQVMEMNAGYGLALASNRPISWSNATTNVGTRDAGIHRHAVGVVKVTNGGTGIRGFLGGGAAVASATALPLPTGRVFHVTGTTNITSITATNLEAGVVITLIFDDILTFTDGGNLVLAGNFVTSANDTITLAFDGTNFYETARSVN